MISIGDEHSCLRIHKAKTKKRLNHPFQKKQNTFLKPSITCKVLSAQIQILETRHNKLNCFPSTQEYCESLLCIYTFAVSTALLFAKIWKRNYEKICGDFNTFLPFWKILAHLGTKNHAVLQHCETMEHEHNTSACWPSMWLTGINPGTPRASLSSNGSLFTKLNGQWKEGLKDHPTKQPEDLLSAS